MLDRERSFRLQQKHLKISEDELAGREVRDVVAETLRLHPEYYLYVFDKHDITQLQKFQKFEENKKYQMAFDTVGRAIALGLLSVKASGRNAGSISVSSIWF